MSIIKKDIAKGTQQGRQIVEPVYRLKTTHQIRETGRMKPNLIIVLVLFLMFGLVARNGLAAEPDSSYLASKEPFIGLENINDEVQAWATCSASLNILSNIMKDESPNMALQLNNLSNGSDVAILMSQVSRVLADEDFDINELNATITYGKLQMDEMPKAEQARILSDLEAYGFEVMMIKLNGTLEQCVKNNEAQKMYVDMMRDMVRSGVFAN